MSYAEVAASGPSQSAEDVSYISSPPNRADPVPSLSHSESDSVSLIDVENPHVTTVNSEFRSQEIKTETQATRIEHEAEDKMREMEAAAKSARDKASQKAKEAKAAAKKEGKHLKDNSNNPVYVGNTLIWTIGAIALGVGAYQKHSEGKLDMKLAGTVAAGVGAFAVADYFVSSWLLENQFPPN